MIITIDKDYFIPNDFSDLTLKDFVAINDFIEKNKVDEISDDLKLDFYVNYISLFGIEKDALKGVKLLSNNENELGIINLFNHLWQFTQMPSKENITEFTKFEFEGVTYGFNKNSVNLTGGVRPMNDYTFEEYEEANSILTSMNMVSEGKLEHLSLLCAIFYRPIIWKRFKKIIAPYNAETVKQRADLFMNLPMDKIFAAYFFLLSRIIGYNEDIANSLLKEVKAIVR